MSDYTPPAPYADLTTRLQGMTPEGAKVALAAALREAFYQGVIAGMEKADRLHAQYPLSSPAWWKFGVLKERRRNEHA